MIETTSLRLRKLAACCLAAVFVVLMANSSVHGQSAAAPWIFNQFDQTLIEDFSDYRGTEITLPGAFFVTTANGAKWGGVDDGSLHLNSATNDAFYAYRSLLLPDEYSFGIFEGGSGSAGLRDSRLFLEIINNTGNAIEQLLVTYDVEIWRDGQRHNLIRLKYNNHTSGFSQLPDLAETYAPVNNGGDIFYDAKADPSLYIVPVSVLIDLDNPLMPGQTGYLRWQYSSGGTSGTRDGLGIDNISVTPLTKADVLYWLGGNGTWQPNGGTDWDDGGVAGTWRSDAVAGFDAAVPNTVLLGGALQAMGLQFESDDHLLTGGSLEVTGGMKVNVGLTATIASELTGTTGINKTGEGTLVLTGYNTYDGDTSVTSGTLRLGSGTAIPDGSRVLINPDAVFDVNGQNVTVRAVQGGNYATISLGDGTLTLDPAAGSVTYRGWLDGSGNIVKDGDGIQAFTRVEKIYTGTTTVNGGVLSVSAPGQMTHTSGISVHNGAELLMTSDAQEYRFGDWGSGGLADITLNYGLLASDTNGEVLLFNDIVAEGESSIYARGDQGVLYHFGDITGSGQWAKQGQGDLVTFGQIANTEGINLRRGTLTITPGASMDGVPLRFTNRGESRTLSLFRNTTVSLLDGNDIEVIEGPATASIQLADGTTFTVNQAMIFDSENEEDSTSYQGDISGSGHLVKDGDGILRLTRHAKTYTGSTTINQGVLAISESAAPSNTSGITVNPGGQLRLTTNDTPVYDFGGAVLTLASLGRSGNVMADEGQGIRGGLRHHPGGQDHHSTVLSDIHLADDAGIHVNGTTNSLTLAGDLSGSGNLVRSGGGELILVGDNTAFAGDTIIENGETTVQPGSTLGFGALIFKAPIANRIVNLNNVAQAVSHLSGEVADEGSAIISTATNHTFTVNQSGDSTFEGAITGAGSFVKDGAGTLTLTGTHSYSGPTTIAGGTLIHHGKLNPSSEVTVGLGATLAGSGSVASVSGAGTISPGASTGILTATQISPNAGLNFGLEFTAVGDPNYASPLASGNDVLRLTNMANPFATGLHASNVINLYFDPPGQLEGNAFRGGLFTDLPEDFLDMIADATFHLFVMDPNGLIEFGGKSYSVYEDGPAFSLSTVSTAADFGSGLVNGRVMQISWIDTAAPPNIIAAVSRKTHGTAGTFDIDVLAGARECRTNGVTRLVVTFDQDVAAVGSPVVGVTSGSVSNVQIDGSVVTVDLSGGVQNGTLSISFPGLADKSTGNHPVTGTINALVKVGDVNDDGLVAVTDMVLVRNSLNQEVTSANFRIDVTADGLIAVTDMVAVRNNLGQ